MDDAESSVTEGEAEHRSADPFSPLRPDNLRRAGLGVAVAIGVFAVVLATAWALRTPAPSAQVQACELIDGVGTVTLDGIVDDGSASAVYRQLAHARRLAADSGHGALAEAVRTAMVGLADAVDPAQAVDGRAAALFSQGLTDAGNECSILQK